MSPGTPPTRRVPPPTIVPAPPADPASLDPLLYVWASGTGLVRCYDVNWGSRDFHAGDAGHRGRFSPFRAAVQGDNLPVLYAANDLAGALSETIFHDVPARGTKHVPIAKLRHRLAVTLVADRDLRLVDLTSDGLRRLDLSRAELIESDARTYSSTAAWARTLHAHPEAFDGLTWVSRQRDTSRAVIIFGDRVAKDSLSVSADEIPLPLALGAGLERVLELADRADITITGLA